MLSYFLNGEASFLPYLLFVYAYTLLFTLHFSNLSIFLRFSEFIQFAFKLIRHFIDSSWDLNVSALYDIYIHDHKLPRIIKITLLCTFLCFSVSKIEVLRKNKVCIQ